MTSTHITHEQAYGLMTGRLTKPEWDAGVRLARVHADTPSDERPGESILHTTEHSQRLADDAWRIGDVENAAYWAGYTAGAIRFRQVPGMTVIAAH